MTVFFTSLKAFIIESIDHPLQFQKIFRSMWCKGKNTQTSFIQIVKSTYHTLQLAFCIMILCFDFIKTLMEHHQNEVHFQLKMYKFNLQCALYKVSQITGLLCYCMTFCRKINETNLELLGSWISLPLKRNMYPF